MSNNFDNIETLKKVAYLARLKIDTEDLRHYASTLSKILSLVEQINEADTTDITPMAHPFADLKQRLRPDEITEKISVQLFQSIAPLTEADLYLVPKTL